MNLNIQASQVSHTTSEWELAQRMAGHANAPEQTLKSIFTGAMLQLKEIADCSFDVLMKEKVWNAVSVETSKYLKDTFMMEFCDKILGTFSEAEASEMLEEHKRTGFVKSDLSLG